MNGPDQSNVDTGGGDMVGVTIGGSHNRASGRKTVVQDAGAPVSLGQVMERLAELERAVQGAGLSPGLRDDALADVERAREALSREQPGVNRARSTLAGTLDELRTGGRTEAVTSVVSLVTAVLDMLGRLGG